MANEYNDIPQSRAEEILQATIDGTTYNGEPQSRVEKQLIDLKKKIENGGTGGGFTPTESQLAAMNSGITSDKIAEIETDITAKQDLLTEQQLEAVNSGANSHNISQIADHEQRITKLEGFFPDTVVYGFHINPNESDPSAAVTYLSQAVGMIPAKMGASTFDYGSWGNAFFIPKPCMLKYDGTVGYYLDPNDYSKKLDGTASDVANADYEGNAMMEWGKIWYKFAGGSEEGEGYFYVSNHKIDETYHCWCNIDSDGNEIDHFYTAIYNGTIPSESDKMRSISGITLTTGINGGIAITNELAKAKANDTTTKPEWGLELYSDRILITSLLILIGKSLNTQAVFGNGYANENAEQNAKTTYITGQMNANGLFYGSTNTLTSPVKVFGMENYWGLAWRKLIGCLLVNNNLKTKLTYDTSDGSSSTGFNLTGDGYKNEGAVLNTDGFIKTMKFTERGYTPFTVGASSSLYWGDYYVHKPSGTFQLMVGGDTNASYGGGAFELNLALTIDNTAPKVASSLSCKPIKK